MKVSRCGDSSCSSDLPLCKTKLCEQASNTLRLDTPLSISRMHVKEEAKLKFGKERLSYVAAIRDEAILEQRVNLVNNPPYKWRRFQEFSELFTSPAHVVTTNANTGPADARESQQEGSSTSPTWLRDRALSSPTSRSPASLAIAPRAQTTAESIAIPLTGTGDSRVASPPPRLPGNASGPATVTTVPASSKPGTLLASYLSGISHTVTRGLASESTQWAAESVASTSFHSPEPYQTNAVPGSIYAPSSSEAHAGARPGTRDSAGRGRTKHRKRSEAEMLRIDHHPAYFLQEEDTDFGQSAKRTRKLTGPLVESGSEEDPMDDDYNASEGSNGPDEYSFASPRRKISILSRPSRRWSHTLSRQARARSENLAVQPSADVPGVLLEHQAPRKLPRVILRLPPRPTPSGSDATDVSIPSSATQVESPTYSNLKADHLEVASSDDRDRSQQVEMSSCVALAMKAVW